jgi:hypothetical protein
LEGDGKKGSFKQYGEALFPGNRGGIHDVSWAPLAGRSFHMVVSSSSAGDIIVWKIKVKDICDGPGSKLFDTPEVQKLFDFQSEI